MRLLSSLEKDLCDRILKNAGRNNFIGNIIDKDLQDVCIVVDRKNNVASLKLTTRDYKKTSEESESLIEKVEKLSLFILQLVNLLQMLVKDGYILMLERGTNSKDTQQFGRCIVNLPSISYTFKDQNIIDLLCQYTNKEIYATQEFARFCKKGHIARDEQRFRYQIGITQTALCIAILALLFNVYISLSRKKQDTITINETQLQLLKQVVDQAPTKLRELEKQSVLKSADHDDTLPKNQ